MSIKLKITLWYTIFMILLVGFSLGLLLYFSASKIFSTADSQLRNTVKRSFREIAYKNNSLVFDSDFQILGLEKGIYLSVYDSNGNFIYGNLPAYYSGSSHLTNGSLQQEYDFYTNWKIYDEYFELEGYGPLWVRGITSQTNKEGWMITILKASVLFFPFFILAVSFSGFHIIRKTLLPLDHLNHISSNISNGNDLSKRTHLPDKKDEVHLLARTFDHMMERLEESFLREKQFTSDVSHELRTPLSIILAESEYALMEDASIEEKNESLFIIHRQTKRMTELVSQLLTLARAEQGNNILNKENLCLFSLLESVLESMDSIIKEKNICLHPDLSPVLSFHGDETMMIRLFTNLISNAVRYGKRDGNIWISLKENNDEIMIIIKDDGIGISKEDLPKIFDRFYQADSSRKKEENGGYGLGLSFCKWIVQSHGGNIKVTSIPCRGTEFMISLPK